MISTRTYGKIAGPTLATVPRRCWPVVLFCGSLVCLAGCKSTRPSIQNARSAFIAGDLQAADEALRKLSEGPRKTRTESSLDLAIVELAQGDVAAAESRLRGLRNHFDAIPDRVTLDDAASLATDDNARSFSLAGYEQVLLRSLMAVCSLVGDGMDAEAYCLQAQAKQNELAEQDESGEDAAANFRAVAFAPYLHGTLREATHQDYDDAERAFRLVSAIRPDFKPAGEDIARSGAGTHSRPGHGVVYVIGMVGRGPQLVETVAETTTASLQIASTILRSVQKSAEDEEDEAVLPNIASVNIPMVEIPPSRVAAVGVSLGGDLLGATQTLTDVGRLAEERCSAELPWTIARAVARRVLKESSVTATSNAIGLSGNAAAAFEFAAINAWSATEKADTRCWGLLPREIQVLRAELPAGGHQIGLSPLSFTGETFAPPTSHRLIVEDGRNHYVVVIAPENVIAVVGAE